MCILVYISCVLVYFYRAYYRTSQNLLSWEVRALEVRRSSEEGPQARLVLLLGVRSVLSLIFLTSTGHFSFYPS